MRVKRWHDLLTVGSKWHLFPLTRKSFPELKWVTWWRIQSRHHSSIIPGGYMNPWKTEKNLMPLWYSACYRIDWRTPKTLLPRQSELEGVAHELYEMKLLLETDKQYVSFCLPSMLSKFQSHRYSLSLKSWCITQLGFMVDSSFSTWHTRWGGGYFPKWNICACQAVSSICCVLIVFIWSPTLPS